MAGTYTYDPMLSTLKDRMRFELGDVFVNEDDPFDGNVCAITDEEIQAVLAMHSDSWNKAKLALLDAICNKLSYESSFSVGDMSIELGKRAWLWEQRRTAVRKEILANQSGAIPKWDTGAYNRSLDGGHYFRRGSMSNPAATGNDGNGEY